MSDLRPRGIAAKSPAEIQQIVLDAILDDSDEEFTNRVIELIEKGLMPPASLFLPLVGDQEEVVRRRSVFLLSQVGGDEAVAAICSRLKDDSPIVRASAISSLGRLQAKSAVPALLDLYGDAAEPQLCKAAAEALGKIGDPAAIPVLAEAAKTLPGIVARSACDAAVRRLQSVQRAAAAAAAAGTTAH